MAQQQLGANIELISNSDIRYAGYLKEVDQDKNTISLVNVRVFGTEGRKLGIDEVPAADMLYEQIVFSGAVIKSIKLYEKNAVTEDPAVVSAQPASKDAQRGDAARSDYAGGRAGAHDGAAGHGGGRGGNNNSGGGVSIRTDGNAAAAVQQQQQQQQHASHHNAHHGGGGGNMPRRGGYGGPARHNNNNNNNNHANNNNNNNHANNNNNNNDRYHRRGGGGGRYHRNDYGGGRGGGGNNSSGGGGGGSSHYRRRPESHTGRDFKPADGDHIEKFEEFDFNKSLQELEKKKDEFEKAKEDAKAIKKAYNKTEFFDTISCDQKDRSRGMRVDREEMKRADTETFGSEMVGSMRAFPRGRGGRGRYARY